MTRTDELKNPVERADALFKEKKFKEAMPAYLEMIAAISDPAGSRLRLIYSRAIFCASRLQDWQRTETLAREALTHFPAFAAGYQYLGEALLARGDRAAASRPWKRLSSWILCNATRGIS